MDSHISTRFALSTLIFILSLSFQANTCTAARSHHERALPKPKGGKSSHFIQTTCGGTTFPRLCLDSLSSYSEKVQSSPAELADAALTITLAKAQSVSDTVSKLSEVGGMDQAEAAAVSDCVMTMGDAVVMLQRSLDGVRQLGAGMNVRVRIGNCQTWVSTAVTDVNACKDSGIKGAVRDDVVNAAQLASNALSLVNGLAASVLPKNRP